MLHLLNTVMKAKTKADDVIEGLRVNEISSGNVRTILNKFKYFSKKMMVLAARSELATINIEVYADCTDRVDHSGRSCFLSF